MFTFIRNGGRIVIHSRIISSMKVAGTKRIYNIKRIVVSLICYFFEDIPPLILI